jgi:tRNA nucleotidyltransferase (CCA-adding enzyme)
VEEVEKRAAILHMGPPYFSSNVPRFVETYLSSERMLIHPFPRNGRWWTILKPKVKDVREAISRFLSSSEYLKGFSEKILEFLSRSTIRLGEDVVNAVENPEYISFLERCMNPFPWLSK